MNDALGWLFGLDTLGWGDDGVAFSFARPLPAWGWLLVILASGALAWWSYWRLTGGQAWRATLAGIRGLFIVVLALLAAGPQLVRANEQVERDWVLVLVDRSASMSVRDVPGTEAGSRASREEQLQRAIRESWAMWSELAQGRTLLWLGFDTGAFDLRTTDNNTGAPTGLELGDADGQRTSLGRALEQGLRRAAARPVSGVVVLSDGRSIDEAGRQSLRRLQAERIPVITVPLGSPEPVTDLALVRADAPSMAFLRDTVAVHASIDRLGSAAPSTGDSPGRVQLIERSTQIVLDEQPLPTAEQAWENGRAAVTLTTRPDNAGKVEWEVRLVPGGPDLIDGNNAVALNIELVDRPLRVVYFDGYPRWEHRYLKTLLLREESIESSSLLLATDRRYIQEGDSLLDALPRSPEEWAEFDVVIMGDVSADLFTREQLENLRDLVALRGAGLLWVAGSSATPGSWRDTPLADLLPFTFGGGGADGGRAGRAGIRAWDEPVTMARAPAAERLGLLELGSGERGAGGGEDGGWPDRLSDPRTGWSQLRFAQRIEREQLKPTAEVLATGIPVSEWDGAAGPAAGAPLVISMRYGAGRVLYVGTDEIWRWRYARGETLPERFWLPLIRLQGRESLARTGRAATLEASPRRAEVDQPVRVAVQLLDQALVDARPAGITVRIVRADASPGPTDPGAPPIELRLSPEGDPAAGRSILTFATTWIPSEPGTYRAEAIDPLLVQIGLNAEIDVALPDDEMRHPETDHPLLARLSEETEGAVLTPDQLGKLPGILPNRELRLAGTPDVETLWDRPVVLILLMLLLTAEWVGRKLLHLS